MPKDETITLSWPKADQDKLIRQIERAQKDLGKSVQQAVMWASIRVAQSVAKSTNVAPKNRQVFKATMERLGYKGAKLSKVERAAIKAGIDAAPYGVYVYNSKGERAFRRITQIDRKLIPFTSKATGEQLAREPRSGVVHKLSSWNITNKSAVKNASKLIAIRYRRLCKDMWTWISKNQRRGGSSKSASVSISESGNKIVMINGLRYAALAFGGKGLEPIDTAMQRAADGLETRISKLIEEKGGK